MKINRKQTVDYIIRIKLNSGYLIKIIIILLYFGFIF